MPTFDFDDIQVPDGNNHSNNTHPSGIVKVFEGDGGGDNYWLEKIAHDSPSIVKVIGVGGCGCNIVEYICKIGIPCNNVDFAIIDHDPVFLNKKTSVDKKFIVDKDDIYLDGVLRNIIGEHCRMIVIVAGVGGGYSASVVASLCWLFQPDPDNPDSENNVSLVFTVLPFDLEYYREQKASNDIALISKYATQVVTIDNERIKADNFDSVQYVFDEVDKRLFDMVETICQITVNCNVHFDYSDIVKTLKSGGNAVFAMGFSNGSDRAKFAAENLVYNIERTGCQLGDAEGCLLYIRHPASSPLTVEETNVIIQRLSPSTANASDVLWSATEDLHLAHGELVISAIVVCDRLAEISKMPSFKDLFVFSEPTEKENNLLEDTIHSFLQTCRTEDELNEFNEQIEKRRKETVPFPKVAKVIGVGQCGCNIVNGLELPNVDLVIIDNDRHSLKEKNVSDKHFIEKDDPALGDKIREILGGFSGVLFVVAGMGGEYSAPIVTELCRQLQSGEKSSFCSVSIAISVTPFDFEKRGEKADKDIAMIAKEATKVITVDNEPKYKHIPDWPVLLTMNQVSQNISNIIYSICCIIMKYDYNPVNYIDFATALKSGIKAVAATGRGKGGGRAIDATRDLLWNFASMGYHEFGDMKNLLLYISVSQEHHLTFQEFDDITQMMCMLFNQDANILWNASEDRCKGDEIVYTAVAIF
jgi:cell division protein FtsZ